MKNAAYIKTLSDDLAHWSSLGWISPETVVKLTADAQARHPLKDRRDAAGWIGLGGACLAGLAFIAFIAANWGMMAPGWRLILILSILLGLSLATALAAMREDAPRTRNGLALVTALAFAAGIGLIGQSFNMPGGPGGLYLLATLGGLGMGYAARSSAAGLAALGFGVFWYVQSWDFMGATGGFKGEDALAVALLVGLAFLARREGSRALGHGLILAAGCLSVNWIGKLLVTLYGPDARFEESVLAFLALIWVGIGALARQRLPRQGMLTLYGYAAWFAGLLLLVCSLDWMVRGMAGKRCSFWPGSALVVWAPMTRRAGWPLPGL